MECEAYSSGVAPADGTGVAQEDRTGVSPKDRTGVNPACPPGGSKKTETYKLMYVGCSRSPRLLKLTFEGCDAIF